MKRHWSPLPDYYAYIVAGNSYWPTICLASRSFSSLKFSIRILLSLGLLILGMRAFER